MCVSTLNGAAVSTELIKKGGTFLSVWVCNALWQCQPSGYFGVFNVSVLVPCEWWGRRYELPLNKRDHTGNKCLHFGVLSLFYYHRSWNERKSINQSNIVHDSDSSHWLVLNDTITHYIISTYVYWHPGKSPNLQKMVKVY